LIRRSEGLKEIAMEKNNNKPKLRFPGFTDPWEQRKLRDVLINRRILQRQSENTPRLAFASGQGVIKLSERKTNNRDQLIADEFSKNYLLTEYNDIVYNPANLKYGAIDRNKLGRGVISPIYVTFTTEEIPSFVERIVTTEKFKLKALQFEEGTVVKRQLVSSENLLSFDEMFAPTKEEQQKIGGFFDYLDNLITLHQCKLNHLQDKKKSLLQKMFPKNGEYFPKLRFPEFTDPWEQRKLGEITNSYSGGTPSVGIKEYYNGSIPFIRSGEINSCFTELFITEKGLNNSSARIVNKGDILYALYGATSGEVAISKLTGAINQAILAIQPMGNYNAEYLMQWLRKSKQNIVNTFIQGGQGNLSGTIVKNLIIEVPKYDEQLKIGNFFNNLDNLITLHQRKLNHLKEQKKALLQQMFI